MNKNRAFTLIELAVVAGIFLLMIVALTPFVRLAKERARRITCANNLRKISLGLHAYAADHQDAFPTKLEELYPNYVEDEKVFDCPSSKTIGTKNSPDYKYAPGLTEYSPLKEVIVEDLAGNHNKSGGNILRIDGSVEWTSSRR